MRIDFVTLFPDMVMDAVGHSILARAQAASLVTFVATNPRDFAEDKHRTVDDAPYGGGPGMVLMAPPIEAALGSIGADPEHRGEAAVVLLDPTGGLFNQQHARQFAQLDRLVLVCGHYEGVDERVRQCLCTHALSIGDYVLTGGELPALVVADAVVRLLPGAIGDPHSHLDDSYESGLLGHPLYTRPLTFRGEPVPAVLTGGNHGEVERWRRAESLKRTRSQRPDLFAQARLEDADLGMLG